MNRAVAWSAIEAAAGGALSLLSAVLIARLIGPEELGLAAAAIAGHVVLWVGVNGLFADALVQRAECGDDVASAALWAGGAAGVLAALAQGGIGWLLAWQLGDPRQLAMGLGLAATLPVVGMAGIAQGLLTRRGAYRALAARTVLGQGMGVAIGVGLALRGAGAWAMVAQQVATTGIGALTLLVLARWRPRLVCRWTDLRDLLRVGLPLTGSTLTQIARYRVFAVLVGACAGPAELGQTHMAFRLVDTVRDLAFTALWRLLLPDLSRLQHDRAAMLARVDRLLVGCVAAILPLSLLLAVVIPPATRLLLGPAWAAAGMAALPLTGLMTVMAVTMPSGVALVALGQVRLTLYANLAALALCMIGTWALRPGSAWDAVLLWCAAQALVVPYALRANAAALGVGVARLLSPRHGLGPWRARDATGT